MQNKKSIFSSMSLIIISCFLFLSSVVLQSQAEAVTVPIGSQGNQLTLPLDNDVSIHGVELEICDEDDFISCTGCEGVNRASGVLCTTHEGHDGCCQIILMSLSGITIAPLPDAASWPLQSGELILQQQGSQYLPDDQ